MRFRDLAATTAVLFLAGCTLFEPSDLPEKELGEPVEVGLFEEGKVPRFELSVKDEDWAWLNRNENALKEEYVPATLKIDGVEIGVVGVRYKGQYSLRTCFAEGKDPCPRASLKIKFDEYRGRTRVDGMTKINLHFHFSDDSMLRERLSYRLFREMGVETARAAHAALSVNGGPFGLYVLVEQIDEVFLADRWNDGGEAVLWKDAWPGRGFETLAGKWKSGPVFDAASFGEFGRAVETAAETGDRELFERHADPVQAMNYLAVDVVTDNFDGSRRFFCPSGTDQGNCTPHNFYWKQSWPGNRYVQIPWDLDGTFLKTPTVALPEWNDASRPCEEFLRPGDGRKYLYTACDPWFKALRTLYPDEWKAAVKRLMKGPMSGYLVERWLKEWKKEIEPIVDEDTLFLRHPKYDKTWWEKGYSGLTIVVGKQRQLMQDRLDGKLP